MIEEHERCLHALEVEPRSARSGEIVAFAFRLRNRGSGNADPATLRLVLPAGMEPLDPLEVQLGGVAPGDEIRATFRARVGRGFDDRTELAAQALVVYGGTAYPTNRAAVRVRTPARFDGPASGTHVERVDAQTARVIATVTNEGDGPAHDVVLTIRAPAGCSRLDEDGPQCVRSARLEPGATLTGELLARIETPFGTVCADECDVAARGAAPLLLPVRSGVALEPLLGEPELRIVPGSARADVLALIRNEGWADAQDVPVSILLPPPLRVAGATLRIDGVRYALRASRAATGAPVHITQGTSPLSLRLARVPARGTIEIAFAVACPTNAAPVTIEVFAGERRAIGAVSAPATRDLRLRIADAPRWVEPHGQARLTIEVFNAGDAAQDLSIALEAEFATAGSVHVRAAARTLQCVDLHLQLAAAAEGMPDVRGEVVARDGAHDCARLAFSFPLRERIWLALEEAPAVMPPDLSASLAAADEVAYGTPLQVGLAIDAREAVEELVVQIEADPACAYVVGSTTVDRRALAEDGGPAHLHRGLRLRRIAAGTHVEIGWSQLPLAMPASGALTISGSLCVEGERRSLQPLQVRVSGRDPYAYGLTTAAYELDACAADVPAATVALPAAAEPALPDAVTLAFRPDWHDATRRLLQRNDDPGLLPHILALRALFPDRWLSGDAALAGVLDAARTALRDVFDRLFVKARIPGFPVAAEDIEDPALRLALCELFDALASGTQAGPAATSGVRRRVERGAAQSACTVLTTAPLGAPAALRTLTLLVPTESDDDAAAGAVARYADELDEVLRACAQAPLETFDRALTSGRYPALDAAREALLGAVAARASRAAP